MVVDFYNKQKFKSGYENTKILDINFLICINSIVYASNKFVFNTSSCYFHIKHLVNI